MQHEEPRLANGRPAAGGVRTSGVNGVSSTAGGGIAVVARTTLVDRAVGSLLDAIGGGGFAAGEKLPNEHDLAAQLGVSRTATREALQRLVSLEVVEARHGHGYFIRPYTAARAIRPEVLALAGPDEWRELLEARAALEKELAALAAKRATADDLARLRAALGDLSAAIASSQPGTEADVAFHLAVAGAARNRFLLRLTDVIRAYLERMRTSLPSWTHNRSDVLAAHQAIYDAVAARDADAATVAMQQHMAMVFRQFEARHEHLIPQTSRPPGP
jgi:GntR family transcriptional repressor for pyruvate dehydrogenase complex